MNKEFTLQNFKASASKTGQILTQKGYKIPQSTLYHALAVFVGAKNWNTLQAELQSTTSSEKLNIDSVDVAKYTADLLTQIVNVPDEAGDYIYDDSVILSNENIKKHLIKIAQAYYETMFQMRLRDGYQVKKEFLEDDVYYLLNKLYPMSSQLFRPLKDNAPCMGKKMYHKESRTVVFNHFDYFDRNISKALLPLLLMNHLHDEYDIWGHPKPYHLLKEQSFVSFAKESDFKNLSNYFLSFIDEDLRDNYSIRSFSDFLSEVLVELRKYKPITPELINSICEKERRDIPNTILSFFPNGEVPEQINRDIRSTPFACSDEDMMTFKSALKKLHSKQIVYTLDVTCYWNVSLTGEKYLSLKNTLDFLMKLI